MHESGGLGDWCSVVVSTLKSVESVPVVGMTISGVLGAPHESAAGKALPPSAPASANLSFAALSALSSTTKQAGSEALTRKERKREFERRIRVVPQKRC